MPDFSQIQLIIFDWNGVLAKGKAPYIFPIEVLDGFSLKIDTKSDAVFCVGGTNWIAELKKLGVDVSNGETLDRISGRMFEYSKENGLIGLYDWVGEKIPQLAKNTTLAILSNNSQASLDHGLKNMRRHFDLVKGWENVPALKPSPEGILGICRELGIAPAKTLMVGDSEEDRLAAENAGVKVYIVKSGECPDFFK